MNQRLILSIDIGTVNMGCCIIDEEEIIHYWEVVDISGKNDITRCKIMVKKFDKIELFKKIDTVVIERQPMLNPKARVIESMVRSYFIIRDIDNEKETKIIVFSPKYKLNIYEGECPDYSYLKSEYSQRKKLGIYHTSQLIKNKQTNIQEIFNNSKKKDDLADSYLQALSYLRHEQEKRNKQPGRVTARQPTSRQFKYKKFSKSNLKFMLIEDLKTCSDSKISEFVINKKNIDEFLKEWIEKRKDIQKSFLRLYDLEEEYELIKKELVPEIYLTKVYTINFITKKKKK